MRAARTLVVSLFAVVALSAVSVAAASAHEAEFYASISGTTKDTGGTEQFTSDGKTVECKKESSTGKVKEGYFTTAVENVNYSECTGPLGSTAEVSEGEDKFSAQEWVSLLRAQTAKVKSLLGNCTVTVPVPGEKELKTVKYENNKGKLKVKVTLKELEWESSGEPCGKAGKYKGKEGATYSGEAEVELPGGLLEWIP